MSVVSTYQQADEPADLKPGTVWYRDDGTAWIRKIDLSWNYIGEWQLPNFHHLSVEGGTVLGPITGAHGLAPLDSPALTGAPTINGVDIADKTWVTDQLTTLQETLTALVENQIGGSSGNITIGANMAVGYGTVADGGTISLPTYADNVRAAKAEVWGILVSLHDLTHGAGSEATAWKEECSVDSNLLVTCKKTITSGGGGSNSPGTGTANYIVVCKR